MATCKRGKKDRGQEAQAMKKVSRPRIIESPGGNRTASWPNTSMSATRKESLRVI
jgi:hypothetical protein